MRDVSRGADVVMPVQICFDFMEDEQDGMRTIECNPRNSTVVADFHDSLDFKKVGAATCSHGLRCTMRFELLPNYQQSAGLSTTESQSVLWVDYVRPRLTMQACIPQT